MAKIHKALCWALVFILLAIGNAVGLVGDGSARTLFAILPALAWMSISSSLQCTRLWSLRA